MTATAVEINTPRYGAGAIPNELYAPQKAATKVLNGAIVVLDVGVACEARTAIGLICIGVAKQTFDNTSGADGGKTVVVDQGVHTVENSASADLLAQADVGKVCYLVDNHTVAKTSNGGTRSPAGRLVGFAEDGRPMVLMGLSRATGSAELSNGTALAYTSNDAAPTTVTHGALYDVPTTSAASTITLPASAAHGTVLRFSADGTKNGHTVQYRDATGPVNITTALTASKRHQVTAVKNGAVWTCEAYVSP